MTINILHLSDLHFGTGQDAARWHSQVADDLKRKLQCKRLDALIISGDIANFSEPEEYEAAQGFIAKLENDFGLEAAKYGHRFWQS